MIHALHLIWIIPAVTLFIGALMVGKTKEEYYEIHLKLERERSGVYKSAWESSAEALRSLQNELYAAERDMATMVDCCDICLHAIDEPEACPADCVECCRADCPCKTCRNSDGFVWRGRKERSGKNDTRGKADPGVGYSKTAPEAVSTTQDGAGTGMGADGCPVWAEDS